MVGSFVGLAIVDSSGRLLQSSFRSNLNFADSILSVQSSSDSFVFFVEGLEFVDELANYKPKKLNYFAILVGQDVDGVSEVVLVLGKLEVGGQGVVVSVLQVINFLLQVFSLDFSGSKNIIKSSFKVT